MDYLYHSHVDRPRFRLVLAKGQPVPAAIAIQRWAVKETRPAERVNRDVLADIGRQGYAIYELDVEFSHISQS